MQVYYPRSGIHSQLARQKGVHVAPIRPAHGLQSGAVVAAAAVVGAGVVGAAVVGAGVVGAAVVGPAVVGAVEI